MRFLSVGNSTREASESSFGIIECRDDCVYIYRVEMANWRYGWRESVSGKRTFDKSAPILRKWLVNNISKATLTREQ